MTSAVDDVVVLCQDIEDEKMATPSMTSPAWSVASTPSITITTEHGIVHDFEDVKLPEPGLQLERPSSSDRSSELTFDLPHITPGSSARRPNQQILLLNQHHRPQLPQRTRSASVVIDIRNRENDLSRSTTSNTTKESRSPSLAAPSSSSRSSSPSALSIHLRQRPVFRRAVSSTSAMKFFHRHHHPIGDDGPSKQGKGEEKANVSNAETKRRSKADGSNAGQNGALSPSAQTPEVQELFAHGRVCPDLTAVNKALDALRLQQIAEDDPYLSSLVALAAEIGKRRKNCKKALSQAMFDRDNGRPEGCRAGCLEIIHNQHSDLETKVYAYNILSTQASRGRSMDFLREAWMLVKAQEGKRQDCGRLYAALSLFKESARARDGCARVSPSKRIKGFDDDTEGEDSGDGDEFVEEEEGPRASPSKNSATPATPKSLMAMPNGQTPGSSGAWTPRTQKIME